ncbi:alpha/beta hydrolase [Enterococcus quebecensis]|uniref:Alpha/beta hydrolase n=1 Tax=Enterococcus quebecensis TaxID=903983 RepID=A0A1E5GQJ0_9ENTE|nr:alpha/beta hydrolase [Enterococcus quebecensis]OEG14988.1 alpha/beta hydrolase [Enterococcus quebecensis]OJG74339.1 cell surface hydrolase [Enterococcus quebecensis]
MSRIVKFLIVIVSLIVIVLLSAGMYFYNYAVVPSKKDFLDGDTPGTDVEVEKPEEKWFKDSKNRSYWEITSTDDLKLKAIYLPAEEKTDKNVIMAHGYMGTAETMASFAKIYHDLGYNVLVPDARGHGESEGDYIGFGWPERKDYLQWIDKVLTENGEDAQITLYGISMGGATVMMTSGEKLPKNVKAIVEDCGYSTVNEELAYQLKDMFNLPSFPLVPVTSLITKIRAGYFFGEASSVAQLKKNKVPMLFIHGDADKFVPFKMLDEVYDATNAPKEKYVVAGAQHAKAYSTDPKAYKEKVSNFLTKYVD